MPVSHTLSRRQLHRLSIASIVALASQPNSSATALTSDGEIPIATNTYPWTTFARRRGETLVLHTDELLGNIASTGIEGYEPIIEQPSEFEALSERLLRHRLRMDSIYVNSTLHDAGRADQSIQQVLAIAEAGKGVGVRILVTNPTPIRWGGNEDKSDSELRFQAKTLDLLGARLRELGVTLAYHNHDAELRQGGREFHHMLTATDPQNVKLCFDAHWVFRGCGNSEVAVFDALEHYHSRIVELHLRQSEQGVWTETFQPAGDIDYAKMFRFLAERNIRPHLVLEQAVEDASVNERSVVEAHRISGQNLRQAIS
jgi:inosose dehydratase